MINLDGSKLRIFFVVTLTVCAFYGNETLADRVIDAKYNCEMDYMSMDYKQNGKLQFKKEYKDSKLDLALSEVGESKSFRLSVKNSRAYFPNSQENKHYPIPLERKGNKLFFESTTKRVSTSDGQFMVKTTGFLDLRTNKFLQTVYTYNNDRTFDMKAVISGICL